MKIFGNCVISITECLFIDKREWSAIVMHTRQHKAGQENAVTFSVNAIEKYEKRYGFVHVLSDVLKDDVDRCTWNNPRNCGVVYSIGEKLINQLANFPQWEDSDQTIDIRGARSRLYLRLYNWSSYATNKMIVFS